MAEEPDCTGHRRGIYVVEADSVVSGFAALGSARDPDADDWVGELFGLYVAPQHWRSALGSMLHHRTLDAFRELGFRSATLWVLKSNQRAACSTSTADGSTIGVTRTSTRTEWLCTPRGIDCVP